MLEKGSVFYGKYKILKALGKGGMSNVYLVLDLKLQKKWAIKEIITSAEEEMYTVLTQSAMAEVDILKKLEHPALPRIVDIIKMPDAIYVVMDYVEGVTLSRQLQKEGVISQKQVITWAKELCGVLDYLHGQKTPIIYRDMKPANIILQPNGSVKLIDFGIAREYKECGAKDSVSLGTRGYAPPEQWEESGQIDIRSDIYSLGVTLYQLLTGKNPNKPPYEMIPIRKERPELSLGLEYIIWKCTQKNPKERYQNCKELLYDLEHYEELSREFWKRKLRKRKRKKMIKDAICWLFTGLCVFCLFEKQQEVKFFLLQILRLLNFLFQEIHNFFYQEGSTLNLLRFQTILFAEAHQNIVIGF